MLLHFVLDALGISWEECLVKVGRHAQDCCQDSYRAILLVVASSLKEEVQRELLAPLVFTCALIAAWFLSLMAAAVATASMHALDSCLGVGTLTAARAGLKERCNRELADPFVRLVFPLLQEPFRTPGACMYVVDEAVKLVCGSRCSL